MAKLIPAAAGPRAPRRRVPFRSVNRRCDADYQAGMQRHHLLPLRLRLNRLDPLGAGRDFSQIDALVEQLWRQAAADDPS